jgi:hypothetical protein
MNKILSRKRKSIIRLIILLCLVYPYLIQCGPQTLSTTNNPPKIELQNYNTATNDLILKISNTENVAGFQATIIGSENLQITSLNISIDEVNLSNLNEKKIYTSTTTPYKLLGYVAVNNLQKIELQNYNTATNDLILKISNTENVAGFQATIIGSENLQITSLNISIDEVNLSNLNEKKIYTSTTTPYKLLGYVAFLK